MAQRSLPRPAFLRSLLLAPALLLWLAAPRSARADERRFAVQFLGGGAASLPATLAVSQDGEPDIEHTVTFRTKPFERPIYWALRAALEDPAGAWELQLLHHKLYLDDPPAGIDRFEVTHGFNLVTFGRAFSLGRGFAARVAAGAAVTHTEASVRGAWSEEGYEISGPAFLGGAGWRLPLGRFVFVSVEAAVTAAHARVSVARGHASLWNVAAHGLVGLGVRFGPSI